MIKGFELNEIIDEEWDLLLTVDEFRARLKLMKTYHYYDFDRFENFLSDSLFYARHNLGFDGVLRSELELRVSVKAEKSRFVVGIVFKQDNNGTCFAVYED
jgi:hypothetical protein